MSIVHESAFGRVEVEDGVAELCMAMPGKVNRIGPAFGQGLQAALEATLATPGLRGILLSSGHKDFCVGADLDFLLEERDPAVLRALLRDLHTLLRRVETAPVPVVALIEGSALGGGFELALACHRRLGLDRAEIQVGLPEVSLGLIPGAGGTQRLPRLLGVQPAMEILAQGQVLRAPKARAQGLLDGLFPDGGALREAARTFVRENPKVRQPWDREGFSWPGGAPDDPAVKPVFLAGAAMLQARTAGAFPAPEAVFSVVQEGSRVRLERALEIESMAFLRLLDQTSAREMVRTFFHFKNAADRLQGFGVEAVEQPAIRRAAVLGAGMMGGGLAFLLASQGVEVVLRDIQPAALEAAIARVGEQVDKRLKHLPAEERAAVKARVRPTLDLAELRGAELVIEAVVEDLGVKQAVIAEVEPLLAEGAVFASNTSALPIGRLAQSSRAPERFVGLHFFSPVEQMPLLEIIRGPQTDSHTLGRCLALARRLKKTPILVEDGYGFYTTRVFSAYILEGAQLVAEGFDARAVEWGARQAGMVVGPLQVFDEVSLRLGQHVLRDARQELGAEVELPGAGLVDAMVAAGRGGRAQGAGFYDYAGGKRRGIWAGLASLVERPIDLAPPAQAALAGRRLLLIQAVEAVRRREAGVLVRPRDADLGAVLGLGFAPNTGGPFAMLDRMGLPHAVEELEDLERRFGARFRPPALLRERAARGARLHEA